MVCHEGRVGQLCDGRYEVGKEDKTEELLRGPLPKPVETHVY